MYQKLRAETKSERGVSLVTVALSMLMILGLCALCIDLVWLYLVRSEAQRSADAAALAGATTFVTTGCITGGTCSTQQTASANQAANIGNANLVGGSSPNINSATFSSTCPPAAGNSGCFNFTNSANPRITVVVQQTVPLFFAKVFAIANPTISALATAEAFSPSASSTVPICESCVKPWVIPNADQKHTAVQAAPNDGETPPGCPNAITTINWCTPVLDAKGNPIPNTFYQTFVNPQSSPPGQVVNPSLVPGELLTLKPGDPSGAAAPSQYYELDLSQGTSPPICPNCKTSSDVYKQNIECCNTNPLTCGSQTMSLLTGNRKEPTAAAVECLINASAHGLNRGQDCICGTCSNSLPTCGSPPFSMYAGTRNPLVLSGTISANQQIRSSTSVVTLPLYNGITLCPGSSCGPKVTIVGYMQIFLVEADATDSVFGVVVNIIGCNGVTGSCGNGSGSGGGSGNGGTVSGGGVSTVPVRLIQPY